MRREMHGVEGAAKHYLTAPYGFIAHLPNSRQISLATAVATVGWRLRQYCRLGDGPASIMTAKPSTLPARRILLAEDDESMRAFIERALIKAGYEVMSFANGKEAHERLKEEAFTLLLTDIVMPQMDGIELARRASEIDPKLKIMFITGFAAVTLNTDSKAVKDARVLSKPFHLKDLVREIDRLLAN